MKTFIKKALIIPALICTALAFAETPRAFFAYNTFLSPDNGPYLETYLQFDASSLKFIENLQNEFQAAVGVLLVFKQDEQIVEFSKHELRSPAITDTTEVFFSFLDQQRFLLPNGDYTLEITINDLNTESDPTVHTENISINLLPDTITLSSIQLAERIEPAEVSGPLTKSGYDIYPYVDFFYPADRNRILFYIEIYNAAQQLGEDEGFLVSSSIEVFETRRVMADFNRFKRESARSVNVLINTFDISRLPSGNYFLVVNVRDRNNEPLASNRVFFQRSNPNLALNPEDFEHVEIANSFAEQITEHDSLVYFIRALGPISTYSEREFAFRLTNTGKVKEMQQYFYNFWLQHDPARPQEAWKNYYIEISRADANFKTRVKRGYETDRGRVFLQYGPPNTISQSYDEPSAFPYEIWHYYAINGQRNKRFVFYSRDFATNDFELIHSDVIGELANHRWHLLIHDRNHLRWNVDTELAPDHWGSRSRELFLDPR
ncbi:MAG TPA: GWxTD domain-containing protein [Bacteroidales bacterium]|nr:GWxTD domain-containing protein [Bacteroidales bacterium]